MVVYKYRHRKRRNYKDEEEYYQNWLRSRSQYNEDRDATKPSLKHVRIKEKKRASIDLGCRVCYFDSQEVR